MNFVYVFSLAASLLPSGGAAVGFGGYVGKSKLDSGEDAIVNIVWIWF